jgi:hypothetical protein
MNIPYLGFCRSRNQIRNGKSSKKKNWDSPIAKKISQNISNSRESEPLFKEGL